MVLQNCCGRSGRRDLENVACQFGHWSSHMMAGVGSTVTVSDPRGIGWSVKRTI